MVITVGRTKDYETIRRILTHPKCYQNMGDDYCPPIESYRPPELDGIYYLIALDDDRPVGLVIFIPNNAVCFEMHICILPEAWGRKAKEIGLKAFKWIWENTICHKIVASVPVTNSLAVKYGKDVGMEKYAYNRKSFMKNGELTDQVLFGLYRPENGGELWDS